MMVHLLRKVIASLYQNGIRYTLSEIKYHILKLSAQLLLPIYEWSKQGRRSDVCIRIGDSKPRSDVFGLLDEVANSNTNCTVHILHRNGIDDSQILKWNDYYTIASGPMEYVRAIARSEIVLFKSASNLKWARILDQSERKYVRIYHGPITKAYANVKYSDQKNTNISFISSNSIDSSIRSVGSDAERYFRSSAESIHPTRFRRWGYPRFDRINRLLSGNGSPQIPNEIKNILRGDDDYTDLLYAPTHKDGAYETTFFPFPEFNSSQLHNWCRTHRVRIFLRPHPSEKPKHSQITDNEMIYLADQEFVNSATEIMPYMQGIITDYSSIYIPYLLFDRPIIFVKDRHKEFKKVRGFGFDYEQYFPGAKPDTFEEFLSCAETIVDGDDGYSRERSFVRNTFTPPREQTFLEACYEDQSSDL